MRFRFVPKSMTLDDLKRPKCILREKTFLRNPPEKKLNEYRPIGLLSAAKCRTIILVSRNIRYMRIFAGVPRQGAPNGSGVLENG